MNARAELYLRFLRRHMLSDFEVGDAQSVTQGRSMVSSVCPKALHDGELKLKINKKVKGFLLFHDRASAEC